MKKRRREQAGRPAAVPPETAVIAVPPRPSKKRLAAFCLALVLPALAVYAQTSGFGFVTYDDLDYVYKNEIVKAGLTEAGAAWAFTSFFGANWFPLTWLSHMLDCQLFGLDTGAHHLVNVAFHLANTLLLFLALTRMTGQPWRSLVVAGIFALHPLHVESVAWISERKDVLSTFFGLLTLLLYVRYTEALSGQICPMRYGLGKTVFPARRYLLMVLAFALSLLAKAMLVTLPFVFLLLDFWPLRRITLAQRPDAAALKRLVLEKTPLLALAAAVGLVNILSHGNSAANVSLGLLPFSTRLAYAPVAYVRYLGKAFWPTDLAMFYPYPASPAEGSLAALTLLAVITFACLRLAKSRPWLLVGWLWFLGMLAPVIGLMQVTGQAIADRYMYLPLTGLSLAVVWEIAERAGDGRRLRAGAAALAGAALLLLGADAYRQAGYWKDSTTLYEHTLAVTTGNAIIHNNLAVVLEGEGKDSAAIEQYRKAIAAGYVPALDHLARLLGRLGHIDEAITMSTEAVRLETGGDPEGQDNLCAGLGTQGKIDEAILHCNEALRLDPGFLQARFNLAAMFAAEGKTVEAAAEISRVLAAQPDFPGARAALEKLRGE